jgi:hypothetical protein
VHMPLLGICSRRHFVLLLLLSADGVPSSVEPLVS